MRRSLLALFGAGWLGLAAGCCDIVCGYCDCAPPRPWCIYPCHSAEVPQPIYGYPMATPSPESIPLMPKDVKPGSGDSKPTPPMPKVSTE